MPPRILIVEDDESIQEFVKVALIDEGYDVHTAPDGSAALKMLAEYAPALILLDLRMPIMDGWSFLRAYRATPPPHVPIVALTASHNTAETIAPLQIDGFIAKPFDLNDLIEMVNNLVQRDAKR